MRHTNQDGSRTGKGSGRLPLSELFGHVETSFVEESALARKQSEQRVRWFVVDVRKLASKGVRVTPQDVCNEKRGQSYQLVFPVSLLSDLDASEHFEHQIQSSRRVSAYGLASWKQGDGVVQLSGRSIGESCSKVRSPNTERFTDVL